MTVSAMHGLLKDVDLGGSGNGQSALVQKEREIQQLLGYNQQGLNAATLKPFSFKPFETDGFRRLHSGFGNQMGPPRPLPHEATP